MARLNGQQFAEKWNQRIKQASDAITLGVNGVTVSPTKSAAAKKDKFRANLLRAIDDGRWERGLNGVSLEEWRKSMLERGVPRIPAGADAALADMAVFGEELMAFQATLSAQIEKMPDVTLEDGINRATAQIRGMAKFQRK